MSKDVKQLPLTDSFPVQETSGLLCCQTRRGIIDSVVRDLLFPARKVEERKVLPLHDDGLMVVCPPDRLEPLAAALLHRYHSNIRVSTSVGDIFHCILRDNPVPLVFGKLVSDCITSLRRTEWGGFHN